MEKVFQVRSSSSDAIYNILFRIENDVATMTCDCQAGQAKLLCKHRNDIILNGKTALPSAELERATLMIEEIDKVEAEIKRLDSIKKKLKKAAGIKLYEGF